tara:strand:- start:14205 stop:14480 length:276 start_codon:yes stop_codon:yes gene_type:complete
VAKNVRKGRFQAMVSALTMFALGEMQARYAYVDLAEMVRARFTDPQKTLRELFGRLVFNVLTGNTDDHARQPCGIFGMVPISRLRHMPATA